MEIYSLNLINIAIFMITALLLFINIFDLSRVLKFPNYALKINLLLLASIILLLFIFYGASLLINVLLSITVLLYLVFIVFVPRYYFYGAALFMLFLALIFITFALGMLAEFCGNFAFVLLVSGFIHDVVQPFIVCKKERSNDG